jgi:hypothetical protein
VKKGKLDGSSINVERLPAGSYVLSVFSKKQQIVAGKFLVK